MAPPAELRQQGRSWVMRWRKSTCVFLGDLEVTSLSPFHHGSGRVLNLCFLGVANCGAWSWNMFCTAKRTMHLNTDVHDQLWDQFFNFSHLIEAQTSSVTLRLFEPPTHNNLSSAAFTVLHSLVATFLGQGLVQFRCGCSASLVCLYGAGYYAALHRFQKQSK